MISEQFQWWLFAHDHRPHKKSTCQTSITHRLEKNCRRIIEKSCDLIVQIQRKVVILVRSRVPYDVNNLPSFPAYRVRKSRESRTIREKSSFIQWAKNIRTKAIFPFSVFSQLLYLVVSPSPLSSFSSIVHKKIRFSHFIWFCSFFELFSSIHTDVFWYRKCDFAFIRAKSSLISLLLAINSCVEKMSSNPSNQQQIFVVDATNLSTPSTSAAINGNGRRRVKVCQFFDSAFFYNNFINAICRANESGPTSHKQ